MDLLKKFTELDGQVRNAENQLTTFTTQLQLFRKQEAELFDSLGVKDLDELEVRIATIEDEVEKGLADWQNRVRKVNEVIKEIESRIR